jgi:hypothetical protein
VFSCEVSGGLFLSITAKPVLNGSWIERNPVLSGNLSQSRGFLIQLPSSCIIWNLSATEKISDPLRIRYRQVPLYLDDPAALPTLTFHLHWLPNFLPLLHTQNILLRDCHTFCSSQLCTLFSSGFTRGTNGHCLGPCRAIKLYISFPVINVV